MLPLVETTSAPSIDALIVLDTFVVAMTTPPALLPDPEPPTAMLIKFV